MRWPIAVPIILSLLLAFDSWAETPKCGKFKLTGLLINQPGPIDEIVLFPGTTKEFSYAIRVIPLMKVLQHSKQIVSLNVSISTQKDADGLAANYEGALAPSLIHEAMDKPIILIKSTPCQ